MPVPPHCSTGGISNPVGWETSQGQSMGRVCGILLLTFSLSAPNAFVQREDNVDSLARYYREAVKSLTSPQLQQRKALRLKLQRRGYVTVLQAAVDNDPLAALLAYIRVHAQVALFIPHNQIMVHTRIETTRTKESHLPGFTTYGNDEYMYFTLQDDWSFPEDPWQHR
jgi:hypothetical protein